MKYGCIDPVRPSDTIGVNVPESASQDPRIYSPRAARVLRYLGMSLMAPSLLLIVGGLLWYGRQLPEVLGSLHMVAVLGAVFVGFGLFELGLRIGHERGEQILENDSRSPVLYLRSFRFDRATEKANSHELELSRIFGHFGPPVCIGRPGERLPRSAFHRLYVSDEEWQARVLDLLDSAQCVIFVQGASDGLSWEMGTIVRSLDPFRLLLLVPAYDYKRLSNRASEHLPTPLPGLEAVRSGIPHRFDDLAAFMFSEKWEPIPMPLQVDYVKWYDRLRITSREAGMNLVKTLGPFVQRLEALAEKPSTPGCAGDEP